MSEQILNRLEELEQELDVLGGSLREKRSSLSDQSQTAVAEKESLQRELKEEKHKNKKVNDLLSRNIIKIERIIEKEEKSDA